MSSNEYNIPDFDQLKTSTRTVMVYSNISFDLNKIFNEVNITKVEAPLTKKKKNIDKKRLTAPYGTIISVQKGNLYRGIDIRKSKKHWCAVNCRETTRRGKKDVNVNTVIEIPSLIEGTDTYEIKYYCTQCKNYYTLKELKKITNFLNQVTIVLSIGSIILNIMLFKDNFKIAGCKKDTDAIDSTLILWKDYLTKIENSWDVSEKYQENEPKFVFRLVMRNVDFKLGFFIDRKALNRLMNSKQYSQRIFMSQCETTGHTNVNIKMYTQQPQNYTYDCLCIPNQGDHYFEKVSENPYMKYKKKKEYTTFIVFSSSEIILSGRYEEKMKTDYLFFVTEVIKNRELIEERIKEPETDLLSFLKKSKIIKKENLEDDVD